MDEVGVTPGMMPSPLVKGQAEDFALEGRGGRVSSGSWAGTGHFAGMWVAGDESQGREDAFLGRVENVRTTGSMARKLLAGAFVAFVMTLTLAGVASAQ